ncbi:MAG: cation diffusion facilitator family transporter [Myxococcota bacterium]
MPTPHASARLDRDPHDHGHDHGHGLASSARARRRLAWVLGLVIAYAAIELVGGFLTGSLALLSDALHMVSDSAALALSLLAAVIAARPAGKRKTFGNRRIEILAALANGVALAGVAVFISLHAIERALAPRAVAGEGLFAVAVGGLVVNGIALVLLGHVRDHSLNVRGAFLHVASDTLASVGVCLAGAGIWAFGWLWLDPAVSLVVSALVLGSAWQLIRDALDVLMETVPAHLDPEEIRAALLAVEGVRALHCLHVWTIGSGDVSLSSHLVVDPGPSPEALLERVRARLAERFGIGHTTIQIEVASRPDAAPFGGCREACEPVVEPA